jgi:acyl-CoA dehydrogenase
MMERFGTDAQRRLWSEALITGKCFMAFGLTEPQYGSDATWPETHAEPDSDGWLYHWR